MRKMCARCGRVYGAEATTCAQCGIPLDEIAEATPRRRQRPEQTASMRPVGGEAPAEAPAPAPRQVEYIPAQEPPRGNDAPPPLPPKVRLSPPCTARSVAFFKYVHLVCGWVLIVLSILAAAAVIGGAGYVGSGALDQYFTTSGLEIPGVTVNGVQSVSSGELAAALLSLTWLIPVSILVAGLSQLAEGHVLGELLDTNLKLSDESGRRPKPYVSRTLSFMRYVYFIVALGVLAVGVYLVVRTGSDGILALIASLLACVYYMMRSKRLELFLDNDRKAADIAAQLRR